MAYKHIRCDARVLESVHADLVVTILSDIPHPWKCLVSALFHNLEVADLHTRHREVGDLELNLDWHPAVLLPLL